MFLTNLTNLLQAANEIKLNYVQLDQLKNIKRTKSRLKRNMKYEKKMLQKKSKKIPYVQENQKNAKS